jgi:hypothetical protein
MSDTSQGQGWWQASDGKWYPPEQHPNYQPPVPPSPPPPNPLLSTPPTSAGPFPGTASSPPPATVPPPGPAAGPPTVAAGAASRPAGNLPSFAFDAKRWSQAERITGVATLVLFISLFLPWFTYNFGYGSV